MNKLFDYIINGKLASEMTRDELIGALAHDCNVEDKIDSDLLNFAVEVFRHGWLRGEEYANNDK